MTRSLLALVLLAGAARADPAADAKAFLGPDYDDAYSVTGNFGAPDTTIFVQYNPYREGSYEGVSVVRDGKTFKKATLPKLPVNVTDPKFRALVLKLDKDADDEVVLELGVTEAVAPQGQFGGYTYTGYTYVVLDSVKGRLGRVPALERKLANKQNKDDHAALTDDQIRAALGV